MLRFRRPRDAGGARRGSGQPISVIALTPTEIVAGALPSEGASVRDAIASTATVSIEDAVVLRLDEASVGDGSAVMVERGRLIALGQTLAAARPEIEKGILVDVGPYVILAQLERRVADLDAGRIMCRAAIVGFAVGDHWRVERLGLTRIESGHARTVRTGTYDDFEVACTLRKVAAGR